MELCSTLCCLGLGKCCEGSPSATNRDLHSPRGAAGSEVMQAKTEVHPPGCGFLAAAVAVIEMVCEHWLGDSVLPENGG